MLVKRDDFLRRPGIEPGSPAWQASILPLNHQRAVVFSWRHRMYFTSACQSKHFTAAPFVQSSSGGVSIGPFPGLAKF
ncbi:hypothetical protein M514_20574 [Trichuris suis]|uniref:Uncharacterized protein n=1 Tax=Trichuris suis TaxID=68888 RepID=A0A085NCX9_9BILA|nr:hypothetical protein M514_20574 [Trichuris suis]